MTGSKVRVRSGATGDSLSLTVAGDPVELERGLQLAYLLLTDPVVERPRLDQWKDAELQRLIQRKTRPMQVLVDRSADAIYPAGEWRPKTLTAEQVRALTRPAAQAWLERLITEAPIEVAVVGDVGPRDGHAAGQRSTWARCPRVPASATRRWPICGPSPSRRARSIVAESVEVLTPQAAVFAGFFGADLSNVRDTRLLNLAARVLSTRMTKIIREERQLVYSIDASSEPAVVYPGFGIFAAFAPTDPEKAPKLVAALEDMYAEFSKDGPTAEELTVAKKQTDNLLDEIPKTPNFWVGRLSTLDYRGLNLDDVLAAQAQYQRFTAQEIQDAFVRYDKPEARLRFVITPKS